MALALYDLEGIDGRRFSPFCWRAKYALAHKGLKAEDRPVSYADIRTIGDGTHKTVPVLEHDGKFIGDSWQIAVYLDQAFPDAPAIFPNAESLAYAQFVEKWLFAQIFTSMFPAMVKEIHDHSKPDDRAYVRESREKMMGGRPLEDIAKRGAEGLGAMSVALEPLRRKVSDTPFLCGDMPGYADYVALSVFLWARGCYPHPLLTKDDAIVPWLNRCMDLYNGLGRSTPGYELAA